MNTIFSLFIPASLLFTGPSSDDASKPKCESKMERLDTDGSGTISSSEAAGTRLENKFTTIDVDGDGELTRQELRAARKAHRGKRERMRKRLAQLDANGDGVWSQAEVKGTKLEKHFSRIDTDSSGTLTKQELRAARKAARGAKK